MKEGSMGTMVKIAQKKDVAPGGGIAVEAGGKQIALFNIDGTYYAIDDECTHAGGSLAEGTLDGHTVTCPWHGAEFDVKTGRAISPPADDNVKGYKVVVEGEDIKIEI
jgi:nitrite reductase/ring-hydroxylating ferredoxin subunit